MARRRVRRLQARYLSSLSSLLLLLCLLDSKPILSELGLGVCVYTNMSLRVRVRGAGLRCGYIFRVRARGKLRARGWRSGLGLSEWQAGNEDRENEMDVSEGMSADL